VTTSVFASITPARAPSTARRLLFSSLGVLRYSPSLSVVYLLPSIYPLTPSGFFHTLSDYHIYLPPAPLSSISLSHPYLLLLTSHLPSHTFRLSHRLQLSYITPSSTSSQPSNLPTFPQLLILPQVIHLPQLYNTYDLSIFYNQHSIHDLSIFHD
jgi:hypothetical protein